ncbi:MAG: SGNH/GDSL hydrolase family protein [Oscillospiraceae bacterium]|nr:SGNH/GDSL hydrolase family protein [Oscillospiraceae bacterium]
MIPQPVSADFYKGKTAAFFGDSITAGVGATSPDKKYVEVLSRKLNLKSFRNCGASGTTLTEGTTSPTGCSFRYFTEENCKGADLVTIKLGINDFNGCVKDVHTMGQFLEDSHKTVYGALRRWCEKVVELQATPSCKNTKFFFITPVPGGWNRSVDNAARKLYDQSKRNINGWTLRDYCEAMLKTCAHYRIPVLDLNRYGSIYYKTADDNTMENNFKDGLHPNDAGHALIAEDLYQFLLMNPTCTENDGDTPYIAPEFAHKLIDRL